MSYMHCQPDANPGAYGGACAPMPLRLRRRLQQVASCLDNVAACIAFHQQRVGASDDTLLDIIVWTDLSVPMMQQLKVWPRARACVLVHLGRGRNLCPLFRRRIVGAWLAQGLSRN